MAAGSMGQHHIKRWATGLTALSVLIACVARGGAVFALIVGLAGLVCLWEYFRIVCPSGTRVLSDPILLTGYAAGGGLIAAAHTGRSDLIPLVLALNVVLCGVFSLWRFGSDRRVLELVAREIQGVCYIPLFLALLVLLRSAPDGMAWVFLLCAVIIAGDTAALYAGTFWGRHKLSPAVSPGKTVEGAIAGLATNVAIGAAAKALFLPEWGWLACVVFSAATGLAGQAGDLFESELKRAANIKDSGGILPGHGGVFDRIDALLFAAPVAFALRMYVLAGI